MSHGSLLVHLNRKLADRGRSLDGRPIWRIVWSTSQREMRRGKFSDFYGSIFLREVEEVRNVPKYWYSKDRWVLERLTYLPPNASIHHELISQTSTLDIQAPVYNGTYEPIYVFEDKDRNPLPLHELVVEAIMHALEFGKRVHLTDSDFRDEYFKATDLEAEYFEEQLNDFGRSPLFAFENSVFLDSQKQRTYIEKVAPDDIIKSSDSGHFDGRFNSAVSVGGEKARSGA